jgi:HD-like signal output (HDOD) protein
MDAEGHEELQQQVRQTLVRLSRSGELPSIPAVAAAGLRIARDPAADAQRLCDVIRTDVGIAARVLRVANSAVYGQRVRAQSLVQAVTAIGFRTMGDILMAASLRSLFDTRNPLAEKLWDHALAVALAAEQLARPRRLAPGSCFLPGLLHDIGRAVFLLSNPAPLEVIAGLTARGEGVATDLEAQWYGFDHTAASALLAQEWGVTPDACDAIRWHHEPGNADSGRLMADILHVADRVAYQAGLGAGATPPPTEPTPDVTLTPEDETQAVAELQSAFSAQRGLFQ